jgi:hypothetical protein
MGTTRTPWRRGTASPTPALVASQPGQTWAVDSGLPSWWEPVVPAARCGWSRPRGPHGRGRPSTVLDQVATSEDWAALVPVLRRIVEGQRGAEVVAGLGAVDAAIAREL